MFEWLRVNGCVQILIWMIKRLSCCASLRLGLPAGGRSEGGWRQRRAGEREKSSGSVSGCCTRATWLWKRTREKKNEAPDSDRIHRSELTWHIVGKDLWPRGGLLISEQEFSWHEGGSHLAPVTSPWQPLCTLNLDQCSLCFGFKWTVKHCRSRNSYSGNWS